MAGGRLPQTSEFGFVFGREVKGAYQPVDRVAVRVGGATFQLLNRLRAQAGALGDAFLCEPEPETVGPK
jgi:hypothetical protein